MIPSHNDASIRLFCLFRCHQVQPSQGVLEAAACPPPSPDTHPWPYTAIPVQWYVASGTLPELTPHCSVRVGEADLYVLGREGVLHVYGIKSILYLVS